MDKLVPKDHAEEVALFRSEIVGALARRDFDHGELRAALDDLRQQRYRPPGAVSTRSFSVPTLERWYYAYRAGGLPALRPKTRSDVGRAQNLTDGQRELLADIRREHPHAGVPLILRTLVADGRLAKDAVSEATVRRFFTEQGLDRVALRDSADKMRLRWQAACPGALWHGDVCHGSPLKIGGVPRPLRIHGMLDDASRYVVALEAHHTERESDMLGLCVRALRRHGAPDALYLDNGSTYRGDVLRLGCERLNVTLLHARPHDAPARGKMERFWRTLRQGCLDFLGDLSSLHEVNVRLCAFLDQHYHRAPHGALLGKSPGEVFHASDGDRPADHLTEQKIRDALTVRERRRVRRDNTLGLDGVAWELDQGFLAGRIVTVVRCLVDGAGPPVVEHEGKRLPLHPVDPLKNAHRKRPPRRQNDPKPTTPFDPPGALLDRAAGRKPAHEEK